MESQNTPRVGELVIANVAKISKFGAYCRLPEYNDLEVFLPIKEVSSGWIKNIREHIHEGQKLVCSVTFFDKEKGTIDISLKRVSPGNSKEKIRSYNLEKRLAALFLQALKISKE
ncbi:MAG: S1 RNA-binding domain-containing protein, partial [Candidatus Micrarchaeaceae archaeon]